MDLIEELNKDVVEDISMEEFLGIIPPKENSPSSEGNYLCTHDVRGVKKQPDIVAGEKLKKYPYQNIGALVAWVKNTEDDIPRRAWMTAFYIGENTLITAAHGFDLPSPKKRIGDISIFIPGLYNEKDLPPLMKKKEEFSDVVDMEDTSSYCVIYGDAHFSHPNYDPENRKAEYDICSVKVNAVLRQQIMLSPIVGTTWKILGYDANYRRMTEWEGKKFQSNLPGVRVDRQLVEGMSGGPWLIVNEDGSYSAVGVTAGQCLAKPGTSISPLFCDALFREIHIPEHLYTPLQ